MIVPRRGDSGGGIEGRQQPPLVRPARDCYGGPWKAEHPSIVEQHDRVVFALIIQGRLREAQIGKFIANSPYQSPQINLALLDLQS